MKQKMTRWGCAMLLALCAALGLIACGGSAKSSNFIAETAAGRGSNEPIPVENEALDIEYDRAALTDSNSLSPPVTDGRKLIRTCLLYTSRRTQSNVQSPQPLPRPSGLHPARSSPPASS